MKGGGLCKVRTRWRASSAKSMSSNSRHAFSGKLLAAAMGGTAASSESAACDVGSSPGAPSRPPGVLSPRPLGVRIGTRSLPSGPPALPSTIRRLRGRIGGGLSASSSADEPRMDASSGATSTSVGATGTCGDPISTGIASLPASLDESGSQTVLASSSAGVVALGGDGGAVPSRAGGVAGQGACAEYRAYAPSGTSAWAASWPLQWRGSAASAGQPNAMAGASPIWAAAW